MPNKRPDPGSSGPTGIKKKQGTVLLKESVTSQYFGYNTLAVGKVLHRCSTYSATNRRENKICILYLHTLRYSRYSTYVYCITVVLVHLAHSGRVEPQPYEQRSSHTTASTSTLLSRRSDELCFARRQKHSHCSPASGGSCMVESTDKLRIGKTLPPSRISSLLIVSGKILPR